MDNYDTSEDEKDDPREVFEDRETLKPGRQALGISVTYVESWTTRDAFRELSQNWMDGMIEANKIRRDQVDIKIKDSPNEWLATAHKQKSRIMMGFIRLLKSRGVLEITNFGAHLRRKALNLGVSSKRNSDELAGTHGEGFKVAALTMIREDYQVRYESSSYYWNFYLGGPDKSDLYCRFSPVKDTELERRKSAENSRRPPPAKRDAVSRIWEDVTVKIGNVHGKKGDRVMFSTFEHWIKVSLLLDGPSRVIKSRQADLIMDENFSGRIYLKGLFLGGSHGSKKLKFAYNFHTGHVNRDRERLTNDEEEASDIAHVWAEAIRKCEAGTIDAYISMLQEDDHEHWADVNLAEDYIKKDTAKAIWKHLKEKDNISLVFYYDQTKASQHVQAIRRYLRKEPRSLPACIWKPLYRYGLVRTPEEQRRHLLDIAVNPDLPPTTYSIAVQRALRAALALDARTSALQLIFKSGANADLDLLLDESNVIINDKWLDFAATHEQHPCWISEKGITIEEFPCDHSFAYLHNLILKQLKSTQQDRDEDMEFRMHLRVKADENFRQMPRSIKIKQGTKTGELMVVWSVLEREDIYKSYGLELIYRIVLHRQSTCSDRKEDILLSTDDSTSPTNPMAACGCPCKTISWNELGAIFNGLDHKETYSAAVSRSYAQAFIGLSANEERPSLQSTAKSPGSTPVSNLPSASQISSHASSPDTSNSDDDDSDNEGLFVRESRPYRLKSIAQVNASPAEVRVSSQTQTPMSSVSSQREASGSSDSDSQTLEQQSQSSSEEVNEKEKELDALKRQLATLSADLQRTREGEETDKLRLDSKVGDLEKEKERLNKVQGELETKIKQLSQTIENLRKEIQALQKSNTNMKNMQSGHLSTIKNLQTEIKTLKQDEAAAEQAKAAAEARSSSLNREVTLSSQPTTQALKILKSENAKLKANENTMATTLQCVSDTIKNVLGFTSMVLMKSTLEGVLGMAKVVLNDRKHKGEVQGVKGEVKALNGVKREIKDEVEDVNGAASGSGIRANKKARGDVIELD